MKISKVTTVSLTELLLVSMKSRLAVLMLYEQTPVKQLINDLNWNKDVTVWREASSLILIQYDWYWRTRPTKQFMNIELNSLLQMTWELYCVILNEEVFNHMFSEYSLRYSINAPGWLLKSRMRWWDCRRSGLDDDRFPLTGRGCGICLDCFIPTMLSSCDWPTQTSLWKQESITGRTLQFCQCCTGGDITNSMPKFYVFQGKSLLIRKVLLLVWFGRQDAGESLVKDLLQLVASTHCVGFCLLAGLLQAYHLLHIHS